jgi:hypothetical protein
LVASEWECTKKMGGPGAGARLQAPMGRSDRAWPSIGTMLPCVRKPAQRPTAAARALARLCGWMAAAPPRLASGPGATGSLRSPVPGANPGGKRAGVCRESCLGSFSLGSFSSSPCPIYVSRWWSPLRRSMRFGFEGRCLIRIVFESPDLYNHRALVCGVRFEAA